jgi:hypothetical protein
VTRHLFHVRVKKSVTILACMALDHPGLCTAHSNFHFTPDDGQCRAHRVLTLLLWEPKISTREASLTPTLPGPYEGNIHFIGKVAPMIN